jgi:hypothetical protein
MQYSFSPCPLLSKLSDLRMYLIAAGSAVLQQLHDEEAKLASQEDELKKIESALQP